MDIQHGKPYYGSLVREWDDRKSGQQMTEAIVLTRAEIEVFECLGRGWGYERTAEYLGIKRGTVYVLAGRIAAKLPNPEHLKPYQLVYAWAHDQLVRKAVLQEQEERTAAARRAFGFVAEERLRKIGRP
jgi:DNA-binding CsgD family transcriptional regulator